MTDLMRKNHDKYMSLALLPLIFCGCVLYGARVLLLTVVAAATAKAVDIIVSMVRKTAFDEDDTSSILSAVIFCLMLPANIPVYIVIATVALTILVGKHLFGGAGVYPFNLAALAMCCAAVNWPEHVFSAVVPFTKINFWNGNAIYTTVSNATILKEGGVPVHTTFQLLLGNYPGTMGSDFVIVIVVLGIFLALKKVITWHIPVSFLSTCAVIAFLFPRVYGFSRVDSVSLEMLNGSVFFVALFMLNEPTTTPQTPKAKIIFGVLAGALGMLFRYFGSFEIGTCFALLIVNSLDRYIDSVVTQQDRVK
ncbi:MAG: RnfABCDGE type electron transport complex subunit D, partial [Oscillospiraceae bacterium]|nr:RnfABCDGE type electron transport complex subunit D [Oscillospiraceae bacterium]